MNFPQAVNPNNRLNAEHVNYIGSTGSCKTTAIRKLKFIKATDQAIIFDPYCDHADTIINKIKVQRFEKWSDFYSAAWKMRQGKGASRLALVGKPRTPENLERFAKIAWSLGNGTHSKKLHVVIEELARFTQTPGKLVGTAGELWTGGRKFGLVMHATFQRAQEVPNTVLSEASTVYIGSLGSRADAKYISDKYDIPVDTLIGLKSAKMTGGIADYILKKDGIDNYKQLKIDARK